jgi:hypothetical protein
MSTSSRQTLIEKLDKAVELAEQLRVSVETWASANEQRHTKEKGLSYEHQPNQQVPN